MNASDIDQRALDTVRQDAEHYRRLWRDTFAAACVHIAEKQVLARQLAETRAELARYTRERAA